MASGLACWELINSSVGLRDTRWHDIISCVDWQGTRVSPAFLQVTVPKMYSGERKQSAFSEAVVPKLFETIVLQAVVHRPALAERRQLKDLAQSAWRTALLPFRWDL